MSKQLPAFKKDSAAEAFLDQDLSDCVSGENFAAFRFEFQLEEESINLRLSIELLNAVRVVPRSSPRV